MQEETALLQFVALALPAVAILMQAMVRFHEQYLDSSNDARLRTEFRFLEFTFLGLVIAAGIFAFSIFQGTTSLVTKTGIIFLFVSLALIFPATWFTFRRAKYPTKSFDSPEEALVSGVVTTLKILIGFGVPVAVAIFIIQVAVQQDLPVPSFELEYISLASIMAAVSVLLGTAITVTRFYISRIEEKVASEWKVSVRMRLESIKNMFQDSNIKSDGGFDYKKIQNLANNTAEKLDDLASQKPPTVDDTLSDELENLVYQLEGVAEIAEELRTVIGRLRNLTDERAKAVQTEQEARDSMSQADQIPDDVRDEAHRRLRETQSYISNVEKEQSQLENRREHLIEDLEGQISGIRSISKNLMQEIEEEY